MAEFRTQIAAHGAPNTLREAVTAACLELGDLPTRSSTEAWLASWNFNLGNVPEALLHLQELHLDVAGMVPLVDAPHAPHERLAWQSSEDTAALMPPDVASVWAMIAVRAILNPTRFRSSAFRSSFAPATAPRLRTPVCCMSAGTQTAEQPGEVPSLEALSRFLAKSMAGAQLAPPPEGAPRLALLKQAASCSLEQVSSHLSLQQVDCEDQELTAIAFFMHQISLQVRSTKELSPCARTGTPST
jgi:hypothetical protein